MDDRRPDDRTLQETLRDQSAELLDLLDDMRDLEWRKRQERISAPAFHDLGDPVEGVSRSVFSLAADERDHGDGLSGPHDLST